MLPALRCPQSGTGTQAAHGDDSPTFGFIDAFFGTQPVCKE
jgi:hypothetical protein